jgi:hypothetical protein
MLLWLWERDWLRDEWLEQFDKRVDGFNGDCADAVPLLAGRLGRRDTKSLQGLPFALNMVRKLAAEGHAIYAADEHSLSPGNHSKYLAGHFVYPSPRRDTRASSSSSSGSSESTRST